MEVKPFYLSKTLWLQVIGIVVIVLGSSSPGISEFLKANFSEVGAGWLALNAILRLVSKDKLSIS